MALEACSELCYGEGSSYFRHASGTKPDGQPGDSNCACCSDSATTNSDDGWGIRVFGYETSSSTSTSSSTPAFTEICAQCDCPQVGDWRGVMTLEACSQLCYGEGYWFFKHASGTKANFFPGDDNCSCCSGTTNKNTDDGWGIRVFSFQESSSPTNAAGAGCNNHWAMGASVSLLLTAQV